MSSPTNPHIIQPTAPHTHTIISLHGRGSTATTFCNELFESQDSSDRFFVEVFPTIKWVFPCAKKLWAETEQEEMHQWFDMVSVQDPQGNIEVQKPGLQASARDLLDVINEEVEIVGWKKVILAGISQGCATAVYTLLTSGVIVRAFVGLCGWMPLAEELEEEAQRLEWKGDVFQDTCATPALQGRRGRAYCRRQGFKGSIDQDEYVCEMGVLRGRWIVTSALDE